MATSEIRGEFFHQNKSTDERDQRHQVVVKISFEGRLETRY